jgi:hypothetical protein
MSAAVVYASETGEPTPLSVPTAVEEVNEPSTEPLTDLLPETMMAALNATATVAERLPVAVNVIPTADVIATVWLIALAPLAVEDCVFDVAMAPEPSLTPAMVTADMWLTMSGTPVLPVAVMSLVMLSEMVPDES